MATESTSTNPVTTPAASAPTSAPAGTTGQGTGGSSLLTAPTGAKPAGATEPATQPGNAEQPKSNASADGQPTGQAPGADIELKLPDGYKADEKVMGEFKELAKQSGLKSEVAQKLFDLYANQEARISEVAKSQVQEAQKAKTAQWAEDARADKEIGGKAFDDSLATAQKALTRFGTPALLKALDESGLGNHPEVIRAFVRAGKAISEDSTRGAQSNGGVSSEEADLRSRYPTMFKD